MKLPAYVLAVVLFILVNFCVATAAEPFSRDTRGSAISRILRNTEQQNDNSCSNSSADFAKILKYIEIGLENIEITDKEDIVVVLGTSGVGKSTFTQFVANETNSLRGDCTNIECKIIDDSETIFDGLLSLPFLPNLVFHHLTNTTFYDMSGFNDNREPEIEIAKGFILQQVIRLAKRIKIVILVRFSSFTTSARQDFKMLLQSLADLMKTPAKFEGGVGMIATAVVARDEEHDGLIDHLRMFLSNDVLPELEYLFDGSEKYYYAERSQVILKNIDPQAHLSYFLSPDKDGPIIGEPRMVESKKRLDKVVYDNLKFISKEDSDFGLPLSERAQLALKETGYCISDSLAQQMGNFSVDLKKTIHEGISNITNGNYESIEYLCGLLTNLTNSDFSFEKPLSLYLDQLLKSISNLQISSLPKTEEQISSTIIFIKFIEQTETEISFDPNAWVLPITNSITELTAEYCQVAMLVAGEFCLRMKELIRI